MEFDASFNKAYPIIAKGEYVEKKELKKIKKVLLAASLTYVAQALSQFLNISRIFRTGKK